MATTVQQLVSALIDKIYPVGVIIGFAQNVDPNKKIGGGRRQIKDCFLYASGSKALGSTGGEETHVLTVDEMPAHSHGRGTQNITGEWLGNEYASAPETIKVGAATRTVEKGFVERFKTFNASNASISGRVRAVVTFDASEGWTGTSESKGGGAAHNNIPPYRVVIYWELMS